MTKANPPPLRPRPDFPKRAVITAGMPYGNKALHFGHIGGVFIHADVFARFLRDRIGSDNVIFVSGTDCYGSPILEYHRLAVDAGDFEGSLLDFVEENHAKQMATLKAYDVSLNLFAASAFTRSAEHHEEMSNWVFQTLLGNGHLEKLVTQQFFDVERGTFLNGRQVEGKCPIQGCASERGYADECALGHQYMARDLLLPKSTLTGLQPQLRDVTNWYLKLPAFQSQLLQWIDAVEAAPGARRFAVSSIREFLAEPVVHVVQRHAEAVEALRPQMPTHTVVDSKSKSTTLQFDSLDARDQACDLMAREGVQFRTGKTLVPFRLSGNSAWGVPVPDTAGLTDLTFWVWPESLWAPISFTATYLEHIGQHGEAWRDWWCSEDARVYQFIGEDNVYFYGPAQMAMFMGMSGKAPNATPADGALQLTELIVNRHLLFLDKKASSSGKVKPPMAQDLLDLYTAEQLRAHFFHLGLGLKNVGFQPKPLNPLADERAGDPVLKDGKVLTHLLNRLARSCFYAAQRYTEGRIPVGEVSSDILEQSRDAILSFERAMYDRHFHRAFDFAEHFIRTSNKHWHSGTADNAFEERPTAARQVLVDCFHLLRVATTLMHPVVPAGCERIRVQLGVGMKMWCWDHIFAPIYTFMDDPETHQPLFLEPRVDFFAQHPSQFRD